MIEAREHGCTSAAAEGLDFEGVAGKALLGGEPAAAGAPPNTGGLREGRALARGSSFTLIA